MKNAMAMMTNKVGIAINKRLNAKPNISHLIEPAPRVRAGLSLETNTKPKPKRGCIIAICSRSNIATVPA
jgi:hypothetical protein